MTVRSNGQSRIRLIRDGIVIFTGELDSLKRFKEDAREVKPGYECGITIRNFNDIKVGDTIEAFEETEEKEHCKKVPLQFAGLFHTSEKPGGKCITS